MPTQRLPFPAPETDDPVKYMADCPDGTCCAINLGDFVGIVKIDTEIVIEKQGFGRCLSARGNWDLINQGAMIYQDDLSIGASVSGGTKPSVDFTGKQTPFAGKPSVALSRGRPAGGKATLKCCPFAGWN